MSSTFVIGSLNVSYVEALTFEMISVEEEPLLDCYRASILTCVALVLLIAGVMVHFRVRTMLTRFNIFSFSNYKNELIFWETVVHLSLNYIVLSHQNKLN